MWSFCVSSDGELFNNFKTLEVTSAVALQLFTHSLALQPSKNLGLLYDRFHLFYIIVPFLYLFIFFFLGTTAPVGLGLPP
jgi:hypothetical protein